MARCLITRALPGTALDRLREVHDVDVWEGDHAALPRTSCANGSRTPRGCCAC